MLDQVGLEEIERVLAGVLFPPANHFGLHLYLRQREAEELLQARQRFVLTQDEVLDLVGCDDVVWKGILA